MIRRDGRCDVRGLSVEPGFPEALVRPHVVAVVVRIRVLAKLPVGSPPGFAAFGNVDHALGLTGIVAVVIHTHQVAVVVEGDLLRIAHPAGEDLEIAAVRIGSQHRARVRMRPPPTGAIDDVHPDLADLPVDAAVWPCGHRRQVVTRKGRMHRVPVTDRRFLIEDAVPIRVAEPPEIRGHGHVQIAIVRENAPRDVGRHVLIETGIRQARLIGDAVAVRVLDSVDPLLHDRQVAPVAHTVLVFIRQPGIDRAQRGRHLAAEEAPKILCGLERRHFRHPIRVLTCVEELARSWRGRDVGDTVGIEIDRQGVRDEMSGSPHVDGEPIGKLNHGGRSRLAGHPGRFSRSSATTAPMVAGGVAGVCTATPLGNSTRTPAVIHTAARGRKNPCTHCDALEK